MSGDIKKLNQMFEREENDLEKMKINLPMAQAQVTFLHLACKQGHGKIIQALLDIGADPTIKDKAKKTPYSYCPDKNSRTIFRKYQVTGVNISTRKQKLIQDNLLKTGNFS